jgi:hypothetical protein
MPLLNAGAGDEVDNATIHWPEDRKQLEIGTLVLTALVPDEAQEQSTSSSTPSRASTESSLPKIRFSNCAPQSISSAAAAAALHHLHKCRSHRYCWASVFIPMLALSFSVD